MLTLFHLKIWTFHILNSLAVPYEYEFYNNQGKFPPYISSNNLSSHASSRQLLSVATTPTTQQQQLGITIRSVFLVLLRRFFRSWVQDFLYGRSQRQKKNVNAIVA